jgi:hypothetical protein
MAQLDDLQAYVNFEMPRRGPTLTSVMVGYDGDPNDGGAPDILKNAPVGTRYVQATGPKEWVKLQAGTATWTESGGGGGGAATEVRTLYVGKHGDNGNAGTNKDVAKLTIGSAITAASLLTPSASAPVVIRILDAGTYNESIVLPAYVSLDGENAHVSRSSGGNDVVRANDGCFVRLRKITNGGSSAFGATSDPAATGVVYFEVGELLGISNGQPLSNRSANAVVIVKCDKASTSYRGVIESKSTALMQIDIQSMVLNASGTWGILNGFGAQISGRIGSLRKASGGLTGTTGVEGGLPTTLVIGVLEADKAAHSPFGNTNNIIAGSLSGTLSGSGTNNVVVANGSFNRGLGVWGVTPPSAQSSKINDATDLASAITAVNAAIDVFEAYGFSSAT